MSRATRIFRNIAIGLTALIILIVAAVVIAVHTDAFRNFARSKILAAIDEGTGGRAEMGGFSFDPGSLRAVITNLVIHGTEPAGAAPLLRVERVEVAVKPFGGLKHIVGVKYLTIERPQANVMVFADGHTNIPVPKTTSSSNGPPLETVVDLAVGHFELNNGQVVFDSLKMPLDVHANNLRAQLWFHTLQQDYQGTISLQPIYVAAGRNTPVTLTVTLPLTLERDRIRLDHASIRTASSGIEINGAMENLRQPKINARVEGQLSLGELGQVAQVSAHPEGMLKLQAQAAVDPNGAYHVTGHLDARDVSFQQGSQRIRNVDLTTGVQAAPDRVELSGLRLAALGAEFTGNASLVNSSHYQVNGEIRHLDLQRTLREVAQTKVAYSGTISGTLLASGNLDAPGTTGIEGQARLSIAPGRHGIPVRGRIDADYSGARDDVLVRDSWLALPHSRLTLAGSLRNRVNVLLTTRDLSDFAATPVRFNGGQATFAGAVTGGLSKPVVQGHLAANQFQVSGRQFNTLAADVDASTATAVLRNGLLTRGAMQAQFSGSANLKNKTMAADATVRNGDLADIMAMAGQPPKDYAGALSAQLHVAGPFTNPAGAADLHIANGVIQGEPFDSLDAQVKLADQLATIPAASVVSGSSRMDLTAEFQHPRDSFSTGRIHARLQSNRIDLAQIHAPGMPANSGGQVQLSADVNGDLAASGFRLSSVNADASAHGLRFEGQNYGDATLTAHTSGKTANVDVVSDFAGSNIRVHGVTQLEPQYPTTADAQVSGLAIERVLAVAQRKDIPARGKLSGTAHVQGTLQNPEGSVNLQVANAVIYDEPIDSVRARASYLAQRIEVPQLEIVAGPSRIALTARFDHPAGKLDTGDLQFRVEPSRLDLARLRNVQKLRPGVGGILQIATDGTAAVRNGSPSVLLTSLNANVSAADVVAQGNRLGGFTLAAHTAAGNRLDFNLNSNLAGASIDAKGNAQLGGDYPVDAQLSFQNVKWSRLQPLLGPPPATAPAFEAMTEGKATVSGPILQVDRLRGSLQLAKLEVDTVPGAPNAPRVARPISIRNQGPVTVSFDQGTVKLDNLHLTGPQTDIRASGTLGMKSQALAVTANANVDLTVLRNFSKDITSSGSILLTGNVRGTTSQPLMDGRMELRNASVNYADLPNGISNANGVVVFRGNSATVQNLTAESGGGKITISGFAGFGPTLRMALTANASKVRIRVEEGVSIVLDASVHVAGTPEASAATGTVTLNQLNYAPRSDFGSLLTRAAPPVQTAPTPSPLLDNMKLDIRVRTSPAVQVQASLAENLQISADLRVRGIASQPAVLGRIELLQGKLVFFGSTYTVNTGSISFYDVTRIDPILNLSLETLAKGVDVVLRVTGPVDNMKLSYTSDPPLRFDEIVSLLATGKTPTSDPTLLANQPAQPPQTFEQMGESAILSEAVASPIAGRLQRVFGVSQLKIDPTFTGASQLPTAQVTLQEQVTKNLTFTYVSALDDPNSTLIRAEWALNPRWSATATRDQNGIVSVNLLYKKEFR